MGRINRLLLARSVLLTPVFSIHSNVKVQALQYATS